MDDSSSRWEGEADPNLQCMSESHRDLLATCECVLPFLFIGLSCNSLILYLGWGFGLENNLIFFSLCILRWRFRVPPMSPMDEATFRRGTLPPESMPENAHSIFIKREARAEVAIALILCFLGMFSIGRVANGRNGLQWIEDASNTEGVPDLDGLFQYFILIFAITSFFALIQLQLGHKTQCSSMKMSGSCALFGVWALNAYYFQYVKTAKNISAGDENTEIITVNPTLSLMCSIFCMLYGLRKLHDIHVKRGMSIASWNWWKDACYEKWDDGKIPYLASPHHRSCDRIASVSVLLTFAPCIGGSIIFMISGYGLQNFVVFCSSAAILYRFSIPRIPAADLVEANETHRSLQRIYSRREARAEAGISVVLCVMGLLAVGRVDSGQPWHGEVSDGMWRPISICCITFCLLMLVAAALQLLKGFQISSPSMKRSGVCTFVGAILNGSLAVRTWSYANVGKISLLVDPAVSLICSIFCIIYGLHYLVCSLIKHGMPIHTLPWWREADYWSLDHQRWAYMTVERSETTIQETMTIDDSSSHSNTDANIMQCMSERHYSCLRFSVICLLLTLAASMGGHTIFTKTGYGLENIFLFLSSSIVVWRFKVPPGISLFAWPPSDGIPDDVQSTFMEREARAEVGTLLILFFFGLFAIGSALSGWQLCKDDDYDMVLFFELIFCMWAAMIQYVGGLEVQSPSMKNSGLCAVAGFTINMFLFITMGLSCGVKDDLPPTELGFYVSVICSIFCIIYGLHGLFHAYFTRRIPIASPRWWRDAIYENRDARRMQNEEMEMIRKEDEGDIVPNKRVLV